MAIPTLVQHVSCSNTSSNNANTTYTIRLPNPSLSGNCIIVAVQWGATVGTATVTDDASNTYSLVKQQVGSGEIAAVYACVNCTAGAKKITVTFSAARNFVSGVASEFNNINTTSVASATDVTSGAASSSTSIASGSMTTTADGDLIYQFAIIESFPIVSFTQGSSPWALLSADVKDGQAAQYQIQTTHGAITSTFSQDSANGFATVAIALKSAAAGTAPSGIRIVHLQHNSLTVNEATHSLQFPCTGNLLVCSYIGETGNNLSGSPAISDGNSNTWVDCGAGVVGITGSGDSQLYYAANATTTTGMTIDLHVNGTLSNGGTALLYDIVGAASSPFDNEGHTTGTQSSAGNLTTATVTPTTSNGVVLNVTSINAGTITDSVGAGYVFHSTIYGGESSPSPVDQNNGWAGFFNSNTSAVTFVYANNAGSGVQQWSSIAAAFKAPSTSMPDEDYPVFPKFTPHEPTISVW